MSQRLAQHLIAKGLLPARVVDEALKRAATDDCTLDTVLLELGMVSEPNLLQAVSDVAGIRLVNLADFEPNRSAAAHLPFGLAQQLNVVPLSLEGTALHLASAYPIAKAKLKNLGFVLGRRIELWVALECRVRAWQAVLYGQTLAPRYQRLVKANPGAASASELTATIPEEAGRLSSDVLERIARGIAEEPLLLDRRKSPSGSLPRPPLGDDDVGQHTTVVEAAAYERFAKAEHGLAPFESSASSEHDQTVRLDVGGYGAFARELAKTSEPPAAVVAPARVTFPGGVLPPRRSPASSPPSSAPSRPSRPSLVRPAAPARPRSETSDVPEPRRHTPRSLPPSLPAPAKVADPDLDFSDVNEAPRPPVDDRTLPIGVDVPWADRPRPSDDTPPLTPPPRTSKVSPPQPGSSPKAPVPRSEQVTLPPQPPYLAPSRAMEWSLEQAKASLSEAKKDRDELVSVILDFGRRTFEFVGAFAVMKGAAVGWESRGGTDDVKAIRQVAIPLDAASVFRTVALTRGSYIGPVPADPLTQHYLARLGRSPRAICLWPVEVQSRLVAMVYGDSGGRPVSQRRLADFLLFCQELSLAFHELIVFRRANARISQILPSLGAAVAPPPVDLAPELATTGAPSADWARRLIAQLTGPDPSERAMAMTELLKDPALAAPALAQAFPGPTGWSRRAVAELPDPDELGPVPGALARLGDAGASALAPLLASTDSTTRYLALLTAGSVRHPSVLDGVWAALFDLDHEVSSAARVAAASLKGVLGAEAKLPQLRARLTEGDALGQSQAAKALGALHDRASVETLIAQTASVDVLVAQSAAEALRDITRAAFGTDQAQWAQWWAEGQKHPRGRWLLDALSHDERDTRQAAIEELSKTFGDSLGYSSDAPQAERATAVEAWQTRLAERPELAG